MKLILLGIFLFCHITVESIQTQNEAVDQPKPQREAIDQENLLEMIQKLQQLVNNNQQQLQHQHQEMCAQREQIKRLQEKTKTERNQIIDLKERIESYKADILLLKNETADLQHYKSLVQHLSRDNQQGFVSATAYASTIKDYVEGDHVIFDGIVHNYGNQYYVENSTFICPYDGYYIISVAVRSQYGGYSMHAEIMLDDVFIVSTVSLDSEDFDHASNSVVSLCKSGQNVWIRCSYGSNNRLRGSSYRESTFSITLLRIE